MKVLGHKEEIENLKRSIASSTISHSYLFLGKEGIGKKTVAEEFAKTLLCKKEGLEPCGVCSSCYKFDSGNHPDFKLIEAEKNIIKKSQIDEIVSAVKTAPFESKRKIFIIDDAHLMNKESMNGLLKTLEEPADFLNMILVSSQEDKFLPTILSRCQKISFSPLSEEEVYSYISENYQLLDRDYRLISKLSKGSLGLAISLSENTKLLEIRDELIKLIDSILSGDISQIFTSQDFFDTNKEDIDLILDLLLFWFRDLAVYKSTKNLNLLINIDSEELFNKYSFIDFSKIDDIIENIEVTRRNIKGNINFHLSIETLLLNIQEEK